MKIRKQKVVKNLIYAAIIGVSIATGMILQRVVIPNLQENSHSDNENVSLSEKKAELWTCSMHPQIKLPKPGECPICSMDLIPLVTNDEGGNREISVSPYSAKLMELETAPVERRFGTVEIRMVGEVEYDETRVNEISSWIPGRIDRLFVDYTGIPVKKGDHLAEIYSPELLMAQEELIQAIQTLEKLKESPSNILIETAQKTIKATREKLRLWGFSAKQIAAVEKRGTTSDHMTIYSPASGIVIQKNAFEGMYVKTGSEIYTVADLSKVWVQLDAYESDLIWLRYGGSVEFSTEAWPGETFKGTISFIDPVIKTATRTTRVRVIIDNPQLRLKPGMFVRAIAHPKVAADGHVMDSSLAGKWISPMHPEIIKDNPGFCDVCGMPLVSAESLGYVAEQKENAPLLIPSTAPLKTGKRAVVYVKIPGRDRPTYEGREVILGPRLEHSYIVKSGLKEGELVVVNGAFKLDAELQIQAKPSMMSISNDSDDMKGMDHPAMPLNDKPIHVPNAFAQELQEVVKAYFSIHQALGHDDLAAANTAAEELKDKLGAVDMALLKGDRHMIWMDHLKKLNEATLLLRKATDIEDQRKAFQILSNQLAITLKVFPTGHPVQQAFCPMAFGNAGAKWLQDDDEILNPYFGLAMPGCGELQTVLGNSNE